MLNQGLFFNKFNTSLKVTTIIYSRLYNLFRKNKGTFVHVEIEGR